MKTLTQNVLRSVLTGFLVLSVTVILAEGFVEELTVAEKENRRIIALIQEHMREINATPIILTGQALLPDGSPAVNFKIGGWGRSISHVGSGHDLFDTITDEKGNFTLNLYFPFQYWITIHDPNNIYAAQDQYMELKDAKAEPLKFQLQKGISVEGIVWDKDKNVPVTGLSVWLLNNPTNVVAKNFNFRDYEKKTQIPKETKTDDNGRFKFVALPLQYMVAFDSEHGIYPLPKKDAKVYTRVFIVQDKPVQLDFKISTPWRATILKKDGTPAAFYPVQFSVKIPNGTASPQLISNKDGVIVYYRPIKVNDVTVKSFDEGQWFYQSYEGETLPPNPIFKLYSPLTAKGRLIRQATGEPLKNFKFICSPSVSNDASKRVTTDENGNFEIKGIYLGRETELTYINPPEIGCSVSKGFKTFLPEVPDQPIDLGVIEIPESGRLDPNTLEKLTGKQITELEGETLTGEKLDWKKYTGKVVLLEFWATWCSPCLEEIPNLKKVYKKYHSQGFEIIGISIDEDLKELKKGLEKYQVPWTVIADQKLTDAGKVWLYDRFGIHGVPRGILIDRSGKIVTIETRGDQLEKELKKLILITNTEK
ncbi:MAG: redoxin domain-containing protein [Planctomycetaceae bacterium]|jgi:thiol-disulfide isomerase/thioredoxin|nr:redoxin domain-containing protein [Planctomycetaceae bacterium]